MKQLGGTIRRDATRPGRPVVAVDLRGPQVTDAALQTLASQPDLETLVLVDTKISDAGLNDWPASANCNRSISSAATRATRLWPRSGI